MRNLLDHKLTGLNEAITIGVTDEPGPGGANHSYTLLWGPEPEGRIVDWELEINFQKGPIKEAGVNGISNEALLAILIDRLRGFQYTRNADGSFNIRAPGEFACRENAIALTHLEDAMHWLQHRTRDRLARGVEGVSKQ
ncbi:MAG TPA: hypothetical protein VFU31_30480 [Candidatus Binatia bacterium]|nr:hypothetical protein [Candidatus Binatia bacterium]